TSPWGQDSSIGGGTPATRLRYRTCSTHCRRFKTSGRPCGATSRRVGTGCGGRMHLAGCGKSLNRDDSPPQGLKPSLVLHDLRGAKAPLYHSAAGFRDLFRSLLGYCPKSGREPGAPKPGEAMAPTPISPIPSLTIFPPAVRLHKRMDEPATIISMTEQDRRISEIVAEQRSRLRNFIRRRVPDPSDAEDIVQEVFYELVEANRLLMPIERVTGWPFRVPRNRIADLSRKKTPATLNAAA